MNMSHEASCIELMDGTDSTSCKMDHESTCNSFYNCVSHVNLPTFQVSSLFQWSLAVSSGTKFYDFDASVISIYPDLLIRPPIA